MNPAIAHILACFENVLLSYEEFELFVVETGFEVP